jgi:hypothetical protein
VVDGIVNIEPRAEGVGQLGCCGGYQQLTVRLVFVVVIEKNKACGQTGMGNDVLVERSVEDGDMF